MENKNKNKDSIVLYLWLGFIIPIALSFLFNWKIGLGFFLIFQTLILVIKAS